MPAAGGGGGCPVLESVWGGNPPWVQIPPSPPYAVGGVDAATCATGRPGRGPAACREPKPGRGVDRVEPQSTGLFILLLAVFGPPLACAALARAPVFPVPAARP